MCWAAASSRALYNTLPYCALTLASLSGTQQLLQHLSQGLLLGSSQGLQSSSQGVMQPIQYSQYSQQGLQEVSVGEAVAPFVLVLLMMAPWMLILLLLRVLPPSKSYTLVWSEPTGMAIMVRVLSVFFCGMCVLCVCLCVRARVCIPPCDCVLCSSSPTPYTRPSLAHRSGTQPCVLSWHQTFYKTPAPAPSLAHNDLTSDAPFSSQIWCAALRAFMASGFLQNPSTTPRHWLAPGSSLLLFLEDCIQVMLPVSGSHCVEM